MIHGIPRAITRLTWAWLLSLTVAGPLPIAVYAEEAGEPKTIRRTCGTCPEGYAMTGLIQAPEICKGDDPILVQCVPLGANLLPVCGSCPEGYNEVGRSSLPGRCGTQDGGLLTQCQLRHMDHTSPDPTQGMIRCPPNCGAPAKPGQGLLPPPPASQPPQDSK